MCLRRRYFALFTNCSSEAVTLTLKGIEIYLLLIYISCWVAFYRLINIPIEIGKIWLNDQTSFEKFLQDRYWNEAVDRDLFFISFFNVQWIFHCSQPRLFMSHLRYKLYRIWFTISQGHGSKTSYLVLVNFYSIMKWLEYLSWWGLLFTR